MTKLEQLLENALLAQVNLEEALYSQVELQLSQININDYPDVKEMLQSVKKVLEVHFSRLNLELDRMTEKRAEMNQADQLTLLNSIDDSRNEVQRVQLSQMLRDDYAALNLAAMGNTMLHTTALAANSKEIADLALEHLANMTRFVLKLSDLMPKVMIQELSSASLKL